MSDVKQVKVDNWGIYFLQRLKHFFNRTDYCDLTLQFQDNAQLKVHRLVLSACTEYFELLERTCEMYEDCLVMPDDLQADVVVPIVNFMYTGQLEFRMDLLESLYQTSQIMNMPVLTKLLDAHRLQNQSLLTPKPVLNYNTTKRSYSKVAESSKPKQTPVPSSSNNTSTKRSFSKAFGSAIPVTYKEKKIHQSLSSSKSEAADNGIQYHTSSPITLSPANISKKVFLGEPRPTRYELPEELDTDNIFDSSFTNISYTSQPLMVHPDATKNYGPKKSGIFNEASSSKKFRGPSTGDVVECKKITRNDNIFEDNETQDGINEEPDMFESSHMNVKEELHKVSNQLFDQILDPQDGPKVTIEAKDSKQASNIDHAKIISEVLKKYPHLVKSNKNIKLKILNTPTASAPTSNKQSKRQQRNSPTPYEEKVKSETPDFTYETDVLDSKEAARLIALGAENIKGPWICLICGTPGRALHFTSYYKFRRHLVDIHNEKPVSKICEYCGLKSLKRNYLLHHLYTKHGVEPPPSYHFPKCNLCSYVALTEGFLVKHKLSHTETRSFRCNVCAATYNTSSSLLQHIQKTGHKYSADRRTNLQCIYCLKVFLRESNLFAHLKTHHKEAAKSDGIIEDSDDERQEEKSVSRHEVKPAVIKYEPPSFDNDYEDVESQYQIQQRPDGNIHLVSKKQIITSTPTKQKILNAGLNTSVTKPAPKPKPAAKNSNLGYEYMRDVNVTPTKHRQEDIVMIDNNEYIMRDNQLIPRKKNITNEEFIISDMLPSEDHTLAETSMEFSNINETLPEENIQEQKMIIKKSRNINQPIQIVVSNEEEYKALMNSNHSIIFDEGDANKTLTVLSAPHTTALNAATIDLDNTQSNDMMIIQENYPLNVSEGLPVDDSNIVVVYSHPVDDQNKQYQLISSQDIGAQFVQSSAVISQNFETITTSTPVMSAHVIDPQVTQSWQNNIQDNIIHTQQAQITPTSEVQEMTIVDQPDLAPNENNDDLSELPDVTLTSVVPQEEPITEKPIENNLIQSSNIEVVNEGIDQVVQEEMQNISSTSMDIDVAPGETTENINDDQCTEINDPNTQSEINTEPLSSNVIDEQLVDESCIVEEGIEEHSEEQTEEPHEERDESCVEQGIEEPNKQSQDPNETDADIVQDSIAQSVPITDEEVAVTKVTKAQIQNLASEWSEDEEDAAPQEHEQNDQDDDTSQGEAETNALIIETPADVEESVENIQQEMEKQMLDIPEADGDTEESINSSHGDNLTDLQEQPQTNVIIEAPQEKLSSLLNDWEDNDSQEENDQTNPNEGDEELSTEVDEIATTKESDNVEVEKAEIKKDDKIKSLVSDWDDEEEENKS